MMAASVEEERGQSNFKLNLVKRYNLILIPAQIVWGIAPPLYIQGVHKNDFFTLEAYLKARALKFWSCVFKLITYRDINYLI